jgi:hypothetical protein
LELVSPPGHSLVGPSPLHPTVIPTTGIPIHTTATLIPAIAMDTPIRLDITATPTQGLGITAIGHDRIIERITHSHGGTDGFEGSLLRPRLEVLPSDPCVRGEGNQWVCLSLQSELVGTGLAVAGKLVDVANLGPGGSQAWGSCGAWGLTWPPEHHGRRSRNSRHLALIRSQKYRMAARLRLHEQSLAASLLTTRIP